MIYCHIKHGEHVAWQFLKGKRLISQTGTFIRLVEHKTDAYGQMAIVQPHDARGRKIIPLDLIRQISYEQDPLLQKQVSRSKKKAEELTAVDLD